MEFSAGQWKEGRVSWSGHNNGAFWLVHCDLALRTGEVELSKPHPETITVLISLLVGDEWPVNNSPVCYKRLMNWKRIESNTGYWMSYQAIEIFQKLF